MTGQAGSTLTAAAEVAESALLGGRVRLRQPVKGYRAGMDAALLAAPPEPSAASLAAFPAFAALL